MEPSHHRWVEAYGFLQRKEENMSRVVSSKPVFMPQHQKTGLFLRTKRSLVLFGAIATLGVAGMLCLASNPAQASFLSFFKTVTIYDGDSTYFFIQQRHYSTDIQPCKMRLSSLQPLFFNKTA
jgi:hypothetical protein